LDSWRITPHDHKSKYYTKTPDALEAHVRWMHSGEPGKRVKDLPPVGWVEYVRGDDGTFIAGPHHHAERGKDDESLAKRLDVHPMAWKRWWKAERVYFVIEGVLKNDAVLSAIIREDRPESVFNVPSVSLWCADELPGFIEHLRGREVVIVPDADWYEKPQVLRHARMCQRYLQRRGVEAIIAAPPRDRIKEDIKGVDDFLGAGGSLDALEVLERKPSEEFDALMENRRGRTKMKRDAWENVTGLIYDLAFFADPKGESEGYVYAGLKTLAKILDVGTSTVDRHLKTMQGFEWITIEKLYNGRWIDDSKVKVTQWRHDSAGRAHKAGLEFEHRTRLRVHERLRGTDLPPKSVGDLDKPKQIREYGRNCEYEEERGNGKGEASEVKQEDYAGAASGAL
jgi:hypothetical protein